jgi:Asp-tRNA(Asn)/Glu-tRNA(Gln) amidotransferase B subunit
MPAGYQITQHFNPVARNGRLKFLVMAEDGDEDPLEKTARIVQVQIEQVGKALAQAEKKSSST